MLVAAQRSHRDESRGGARGRFAFAEYLSLGIERVAREHRCRHADLFPAEVGDGFLAYVGDAHADDNRERERGGDDAAAEFRLLGIFSVEMQRMRVHGEQREPRVVGFSERATGTVLVNVADREIFVVATKGFAVALRSGLHGGVAHGNSRKLMYGHFEPAC